MAQGDTPRRPLLVSSGIKKLKVMRSGLFRVIYNYDSEKNFGGRV